MIKTLRALTFITLFSSFFSVAIAYKQSDLDKAKKLSEKNKKSETVTLEDKNLSGSDLSGANLSGADLSGANLSGAYLTKAKLYNANLSGAVLTGANLKRAKFSGAVLYNANLREVRELSGEQKQYARKMGALNVPD